MPQGVLFEGTLTGVLPAECVRCLDNFDLQVVAEFSDLYVYPATADAEWVVDDAVNVDLAPLARQLFLLAMPYRPLCRPDCKGLCPNCGENRNNTICSCEEDGVDPRLIALKKLLDSSN
ncbi:MAG TPA: DUF177 domain-containing protein [Anaerolineales bacterium]|nr:DUF177 domain-containing protein [Anaerolineales bacterium]